MMRDKKKIVIGLLIILVVFALGLFCVKLFDKTHTVTFLSSSGDVLKIETVQTGGTAVPPVSVIVQEGQVFSKWDGSYWDITRDKKVKAVCENYSGKDNVIALTGANVKSGEMARVPLQLCGNVNLCGLNITIHYDSKLLHFNELEQQDPCVMLGYDEQQGEIYLNYLSTNNTTGAVDLGVLIFEAESSEGAEVKINADVLEIIGLDEKENYIIPEYVVIPASVQIYTQ